MEIVDQKEIKRFCKIYSKKKTYVDKIAFIKESYKVKGESFHKVFLHSGLIYTLSLMEIDEIIEFISFCKIDSFEEINEDLFFLRYLLDKRSIFTKKIDNYLKNNSNSIYIEDLFNYLEYVNFEIKVNGTGIDGEKNSSSIIYSQYAHLLESFPGIIEMIRKHNIQSANRKVKKLNLGCKELYHLEGRRNSLMSFINSVMMGLEKPKKFENFVYDDISFGTVYFMSSRPKYWPVLEIHRDLNFVYFNELENDVQLSLAEKTGYMNLYKNQKIMKIDFEKDSELLAEEVIYKEYELISPMYGSASNSFIYRNKEYKISDLLHVYKALKKYLFEDAKSFINNGGKNRDFVYIKVLGERALIRVLGLNYTEIELLKLLSFDIMSNESVNLLNFKPLIRSGSVYYLMSTWIDYVSFGRAMDKIFSDYKNVKISLIEQDEKGLLFENTVECFFKDCNINFFKMKKDNKNGIPEIDGMFILDDFLFVFEAKAAIKPETMMEAYNHLNSKLSKARDQLDKRVEVLEDLEKIRIIEEKMNQSISQYEIVPFILSNHHFFNGYNEINSISSDRYYPIIDFLTLKEIIQKKRIPVWEYDEKKQYYNKSDQPIICGKDLRNYLNNQIKFLLSCEQPTFQMLEENIMFSISKHVKIKKMH